MPDYATTLQSGLRENHASADDIAKSGYWLGGTDVTRSTLQQYDLLRRGYGRLFILKMPYFIERLLPDATKKFKHLLEFANVGVDGIQGYSVEFGSLTVGYAGNQVEIPTGAKDDTNSITVKMYETSGSLIRTYIDFWITGVADPYTGLSHYHGARDILDNSDSLFASQYNQTMEALYVATDPTGEQLEYACLLSNMFPKASNHDHFNYEPGSHDLVDYSIEFTAIKYMSAQINELGKAAIDKYKILKNYLNFQKPDYDPTNALTWQDRSEDIWGKGRTQGKYFND